MKQIIIDTNGFLRFLLDDIPEQADQIELLFKQAQNGIIKIILPEIVLFEIMFAFEKYYHLNKEEAISKLESLLSIDYITVESQTIFITALAVFKSGTLSFVDCFLFAKSEVEGKELFTFDKKLKNLKNFDK